MPMRGATGFTGTSESAPLNRAPIGREMSPDRRLRGRLRRAVDKKGRGLGRSQVAARTTDTRPGSPQSSSRKPGSRAEGIAEPPGLKRKIDEAETGGCRAGSITGRERLSGAAPRRSPTSAETPGRSARRFGRMIKMAIGNGFRVERGEALNLAVGDDFKMSTSSAPISEQPPSPPITGIRLV